MNFNRSLVKLRAKERMRQADPKTWRVTLVYQLLVTMVPGMLGVIMGGPLLSRLASALVRLDDMGLFYSQTEFDEAMVRWGLSTLAGFADLLAVAAVGTLVLGIFTAVIQYGYCGYCLKVYRGQKAGMSDLWSGFSRLGRCLGSAILAGFFTTLWMLLFVVAGVLIILGGAFIAAAAEIEWLMIPAVLVSYVGMIIGMIWAAYRYRLTPYFVMHDPNMSAWDAVRASKVTMVGNTGKRFSLDLSFMGWAIVCSMAAGMVMNVVGPLVGLLMGSTISTVQDIAPFMWGGNNFGMVAEVIRESLPGMLVNSAISQVVTALATVWLVGYISVSQAGFFAVMTGLEENPQPRVIRYQYNGPGGYQPPQVPPDPPAPDVPPTPETPPAPPAPETPEVSKEPDAPLVPEMPTFPDIPPMPEPPAAPPVPPIPDDDTPITPGSSGDSLF